jgi:putative transposase
LETTIHASALLAFETFPSFRTIQKSRVTGIVPSIIAVVRRCRATHGALCYVQSDDGPESVSRAILRWLTSANIQTAAIDFGKPWQNGLNESFNGKFREDCLNADWFESIESAVEKTDAWRWDYNEHRPHRSLKDLTPQEYAVKMSA